MAKMTEEQFNVVFEESLEVALPGLREGTKLLIHALANAHRGAFTGSTTRLSYDLDTLQVVDLLSESLAPLGMQFEAQDGEHDGFEFIDLKQVEGATLPLPSDELTNACVELLLAQVRGPGRDLMKQFTAAMEARVDDAMKETAAAIFDGIEGLIRRTEPKSIRQVLEIVAAARTSFNETLEAQKSA